MENNTLNKILITLCCIFFLGTVALLINHTINKKSVTINTTTETTTITTNVTTTTTNVVTTTKPAVTKRTTKAVNR